MLIQEGANSLEVVYLDTSPPNAPTAGDICFSVRVLSNGFAGTSSAIWTDSATFQEFLEQLSTLEDRRQGHARLHATYSPDQFWLEIRSLDRSGHLAVFGRLSQWQFLRGDEGFHQVVEFGFEFCPSLLSSALDEFRSIRHDGT